jgi:hypothetical protein
MRPGAKEAQGHRDEAMHEESMNSGSTRWLAGGERSVAAYLGGGEK